MTGGEPLMDKNTFKVMEYVLENPNKDLELSITTNMCRSIMYCLKDLLGY